MYGSKHYEVCFPILSTVAVQTQTPEITKFTNYWDMLPNVIIDLIYTHCNQMCDICHIKDTLNNGLCSECEADAVNAVELSDEHENELFHSDDAYLFGQFDSAAFGPYYRKPCWGS